MSSVLENFILLNSIVNSVWYVFTIIFILYKFTSFFTTAWGVLKFTGKLFYGIKTVSSSVFSFMKSRFASNTLHDDLETGQLVSSRQNNYGSTNNINNDNDSGPNTTNIDTTNTGLLGIYNKFFGSFTNNTYKQFKHDSRLSNTQLSNTQLCNTRLTSKSVEIPLETISIYESKITDTIYNTPGHDNKLSNSSDSQLLLSKSKKNLDHDFYYNLQSNFDQLEKNYINKQDNNNNTGNDNENNNDNDNDNDNNNQNINDNENISDSDSEKNDINKNDKLFKSINFNMKNEKNMLNKNELKDLDNDTIKYKESESDLLLHSYFINQAFKKTNSNSIKIKNKTINLPFVQN